MRSRGTTLVAFSVVALSCHADSNVSCAPTLTCSLRDARFEQPERRDAGAEPCSEDRPCHAEKLAAGGGHSCAIAEAGELYCWGDNREGQLGLDTRPDAGLDAAVLDAGLLMGVGRADQIAVGGAHSCAVDREGALYCWGRNAEGQVDGEPSTQPVRAPRQVSIEPVLDVAAGGTHTCALIQEGVVCWGAGAFGQAGRELAEAPLEMGLVPGTKDVVELAAGLRHTCARFENGRVGCFGELLDAQGELRASPELATVPELDDATELAAGAGHTCALRAGGTVACWGINTHGQLGDGSRESSAEPVQVRALEISLHVSAGGTEKDGELVGHSCALTKSFFVQCWGRGAEGQLGQGDVADDSSTALVVRGEPGEEDDEPSLPDVTAVATGGFHSCGIDHDGDVRCWGDDSLGQLGLPEGEDFVFGRPQDVRSFGRGAR